MRPLISSGIAVAWRRSLNTGAISLRRNRGRKSRWRRRRIGKREIVKEFCQHCYHLGQARANEAGMEMRLCGGNGSCRHTYMKTEADLPPQDMSEIKEAQL